jgi:hypothetical protein
MLNGRMIDGLLVGVTGTLAVEVGKVVDVWNVI